MAPKPENRSVRVANCSGYHGSWEYHILQIRLLTWLSSGDPAYEMYRQATLGDVDFITGDYLAGEYVPCSIIVFRY